MFLEILKQNNDGTLAKNESGQYIVSGLVNLNRIAQIYVSQSEIPGSSPDEPYVIAVLPGTIEQLRNTVEDATNKKVLFLGSQESCEEYLRMLSYNLSRSNLRISSPATRISITSDGTDN